MYGDTVICNSFHSYAYPDIFMGFVYHPLCLSLSTSEPYFLCLFTLKRNEIDFTGFSWVPIVTVLEVYLIY